MNKKRVNTGAICAGIVAVCTATVLVMNMLRNSVFEHLSDVTFAKFTIAATAIGSIALGVLVVYIFHEKKRRCTDAVSVKYLNPDAMDTMSSAAIEEEGADITLYEYSYKGKTYKKKGYRADIKRENIGKIKVMYVNPANPEELYSPEHEKIYVFIGAVVSVFVFLFSAYPQINTLIAFFGNK